MVDSPVANAPCAAKSVLRVLPDEAMLCLKKNSKPDANVTK